VLSRRCDVASDYASPPVQRITTRNARFQQWQALLGNRTRRNRSGTFVVQGVRPISLAVEHGWYVDALLYDDSRTLSSWARGLVDAHESWALAPDLLTELGEKEEQAPELVAIVRMPADDPARIPLGPDLLGVVFDRPTSPGNLGSLVRSADAFGADVVVVTGHAADPYDPRAVRASTGSLFATPVVRLDSHREVLARVRETGVREVRVFGTDESGDLDIAEADLTGPVLLVIGNETHGLSHAWREECDQLLRIPMTGAASSLNAANAGTVVLYEAARQRAARDRDRDLGRAQA
jgi:tRNA G18 (ribose-2'-O)-methylase SpoU